MPKKKKYFPNNWQQYKDSPDEMFLDHTFQELLDWKIFGWEIPSSVSTMIRETHIHTKKTKEHIYSKEGNAKRKILQVMDSGEPIELTICTANEVHRLLPETYLNDNDK